MSHMTGPWKVIAEGGGRYRIVEGEFSDTGIYVEDTFAPLVDPEVYAANARLVAAAPEMLSALKLAVQALNAAPRFKVGANEYGVGGTDSYQIAAVVDAAIAKAKGERQWNRQ